MSGDQPDLDQEGEGGAGTAPGTTVHRQEASGATTSIFLRLASSVLSKGGPAMGTTALCPVHRPINPERRVLGGWPEVAPPPVRCPNG
jgi:hypothetical protein